MPLLAQLPLVPALRAGGDEGKPIAAVEPDSETGRAFHEPGRADRRRDAPEEGVQLGAQARLSAAVDVVPRYRFERLVADALDDLPDELLAVLDNVAVLVADRNPDEPDLLGLYDGVPHTERTGTRGRTS